MHEKFNNTILLFGFIINHHDKYEYPKVINDDYVSFYLYIGDIFIFRTSLKIIFFKQL